MPLLTWASEIQTTVNNAQSFLARSPEILQRITTSCQVVVVSTSDVYVKAKGPTLVVWAWLVMITLAFLELWTGGQASSKTALI